MHLMTISNYALMSFALAELPRIEHHPEDVKDAIPSQAVKFTVKATGTKPLSYQWLHMQLEKRIGVISKEKHAQH